MKIAIIGGGPIGVEAALYGALAGQDVMLFERGRIGENLRSWGYVRLFTEWERNRSPLSLRLLSERGDSLAPADVCPTGDELADYLHRVISLPVLRSRIVPQCEIMSITREGALKSDFWDDARRARKQFRLLTKGIGGERVRYFDAVIDATGVYETPNYAGSGGAPCPGEIALRNSIDYAIPDVAGHDRTRFWNKHALIVGAGHSAASTLLAIADLMEHSSKTRVTWVVRRNSASTGDIYRLDPNDISSGRRKLGERANALVNHPQVDVRLQTQVQSLEKHAGRFIARLSDNTSVDCDTVCAHTGFRPDESLWRELQISSHPATGAPSWLLANHLNAANAKAGVGLSTGYAEKLEEFQRPENVENLDSRELLRLPEPNFLVLGIKSYGRDAGFLMQNGFRQVRDAYQLLLNDNTLDLYGADF
ncbi:hypothetical protein IAD21_02059 [Abditibacteriota bacterium]|nr:hypothetical protein IAD21_02059 [Abditibacteriota bacterium]